MSKQQDLLSQKVRSYLGGRLEYIDNYRPDWLKNQKTGKNFEIDLFVPSLRIGIEYQGAQHFKHIPSMRGSNPDVCRYNDTTKRMLALRKGVPIIEFFEQDLSYEPFGRIFEKRVRLCCAHARANHILNQVKRVRKYEERKREASQNWMTVAPTEIPYTI